MVGNVTPEVHRYASLAAASHAVAERIAAAAQAAVQRGGRFSLVIPGGETPRTLFTQLSGTYRTRIPWADVHLFWTDERAVPPEDPRSNYRLAVETLTGPLGLSPAQLHRIRGEDQPPERAAQQYEIELSRFFGLPRPPDPPSSTFDLAVLGVGPDGHTASLFPDAPTLARHDGWTAIDLTPALPPLVPRITLTLAALSGSREVLFLVGAGKKAILRTVLDGAGSPGKTVPAAQVRGVDRLAWFIVDDPDMPPGPRRDRKRSIEQSP